MLSNLRSSQVVVYPLLWSCAISTQPVSSAITVIKPTQQYSHKSCTKLQLTYLCENGGTYTKFRAPHEGKYHLFLCDIIGYVPLKHHKVNMSFLVLLLLDMVLSFSFTLQVLILVLLTVEQNEFRLSCSTHFSHLHFRFSRLICSQLLSISISGDRKKYSYLLNCICTINELAALLLQNFGHIQQEFS